MAGGRHRQGSDLVFKALADPTRRSILGYLAGGELAAGDIVSRFEISGPSISRHLSVLKTSGLVHERRHANRVIYSLVPEPAAETLTAFLASLGRSVSSPVGRDGAPPPPKAKAKAKKQKAAPKRDKPDRDARDDKDVKDLRDVKEPKEPKEHKIAREPKAGGARKRPARDRALEAVPRRPAREQVMVGALYGAPEPSSAQTLQI